MEANGYLADYELMNKYIEFFGLCKFAGYDDLKAGSLLSKPLPNDVIVEIVKQRRPPLKWTADSLEKAIQVEKDFNQILIKQYDRARKTFSIRARGTPAASRAIQRGRGIAEASGLNLEIAKNA